MFIKNITNTNFLYNGRGPVLTRWIHDKSGFIIGAEHEFGWIVFKRLQVIQIVPHEVHSFWYLTEGDTFDNGILEVEDSSWIKNFSPTHLTKCKHFILEFYDEIVEVICESLISGVGDFDANKVTI